MILATGRQPRSDAPTGACAHLLAAARRCSQQAGCEQERRLPCESAAGYADARVEGTCPRHVQDTSITRPQANNARIEDLAGIAYAPDAYPTADGRLVLLSAN